MGKVKLVIILVFVLALGSGLVAGMLVKRIPAASPPEAPLRTPLAQELQLTDEQSRRMRDIWEGVRGKVDECFLKAQDLQKKRDNAMYSLLTDEQKLQYAKMQQEFTDAMAALKNQRDAAFQKAVQDTEQMLTESQKQRYREIVQNRLSREPGTTPDWMMPQGPTTAQTTKNEK